MRSFSSRLQPISFLFLLTLAAARVAGAQSLEVSGTLRLADGSPAKGVSVELIPFPASYLRRLDELVGDALPKAVDRTSSGDDGSYRLTAPTPGVWRMMILPSGPDGVTVAAVRRDLLPLVESAVLPPITLPERRTLTVEARDPDGSPVAAAMVLAGLAQPVLRDPAHGRSSPVINRPAARTDSDGTARFYLPAGAARVRVAATDYHFSGEDSSSGQVQVTLEPGPSRRIEVIDPAGRPIAGAIVRVGDSLIPIAVTDEAGRAVVGTLASQPVSYQVETRTGHYGSSGSDYPAASESGDDPPIRIVVEPPERVYGRLVDAETGIAVAGALVWSPWRPSDHVLSDRGGSFSLATWTQERGLGLEILTAGYSPAQLHLSPAQLSLGEEQTVTLVPELVFTGAVVDEGGQAIAGALLSAAATDHRVMTSLRRGDRVATTDSSGEFRLSGLLPEVVYALEVSAEGFAPTRLEVPPVVEPEPLQIVLSRGIAVWGRVVDSDERPLAQATVRIWPAPDRGSGRAGPPMATSENATTDASGRYRFEALPQGIYDLQASLAGFAPIERNGLELSQAVEPLDLGTVVLEVGAAIEGTVVDVGRQPLAGATIELYRHDAILRSFRGESVAVVTSASDGSFVFDSVRSEEQVTLRARHPDLAPAEVYGVRAPSEEPIEIVLEPGATVAGQVVDSRGRGVSGARVQLARDRRFATTTTRLPQLRDLRATSDSEGAYSIARIPTGSWRAWASAPSGAMGETAGIDAVSGQVHRRDIVVEPQMTISGRVTGPHGEPVRDAEVNFEATTSNSSSSTSFGVTDAAGLYRGQVLDRNAQTGVTEVVAHHPEYREGRRQVELAPGENVVDLRLERGWEIRGRVVDSQGSPLSAAQVTRSLLQPQPRYREKRPVLTDPSGRFAIQGLDDGEYQLSAAKDGYADTALEAPAVIDGRSLDGVEIVLSRGGAISGKVIGLQAEQLSAVSVFAYRSDSKGALHQPPETRVDFEGSFRLQALAPGKWRIRAELEDDGRSVERPILIETEGAETFVELEFEGGFTLSGWVTREEVPITGAGIWLWGQSGDSRRAQTDHRGAFVLEALAAGAYTLQVQPEGVSSHTRQIELVADDEIWVDLKPHGSLSGTVVDDLGAPLAFVSISAIGDTGNPVISAGGFAQSDSDGSFRLSLEAGQWELHARLEGYTAQILAITLAGGERRSNLQIVMSPAEALTLFVRRADGQPVREVTATQFDEGGIPRGGDSAAVGPDGRAVLHFLPPGTWELWVRSVGSLPARVRVSVPGEPVTVTLEIGGSLEVSVPSLIGGRAGAQLKLLDANGVSYRHPMAPMEYLEVMPRGSGQTSLGPLPAGVWTVVVETDDGQSLSQTVEVVGGQTVSVVIQ